MKNKIKIFRKLVRCASIALLSFSMAGCGADFLDTTPTNNISGSSIWTKQLWPNRLLSAYIMSFWINIVLTPAFWIRTGFHGMLILL